MAAALMWTIIFSLMVSYGSPKTISKRRLDNFAEMIGVQVKNLDAGDINGYGGWCGLGGSGEPKDDIDRCCMHHDHCYEHIRKTVCKSLNHAKVYTDAYMWAYDDGEIICNDDPEKNACKSKLCGCDRDAVNCFAKYAHQFNMTFKSKDKISTMLEYLIKAYLNEEWVPQSVWTDLEDSWAKLETEKWDFIQEHVPEKYWGTLSKFLPKKYIPESVKEKLGLGEGGKEDVGDLGSGEIPEEDTEEEHESLWTKFKDWVKGIKEKIHGKR
ncbi:phospholipase A2-like isoform X1 [Lineus longissimus]|uniref:phospholipase A2-like isoform X1 n=1 Tax=Lineus longissimus TaxID=88925 RepID=UPI002B4F1578